MRLWFSQNSDVPIYRQLVTQVQLAILSGDLKPGEKLPSTRALARRFDIHPNTVSSGYRHLERDGWVESRHGSGVYVRQVESPLKTPEQALEYHIAGFFRAMRELGVPPEAVRQRVAAWLETPPADHFLLVDPDPRLRQILLTELQTMTRVEIRECVPEHCAEQLTGAVPICRPSKTKLVRDALPSGTEMLTLPINSAPAWLAPWLAAAPEKLVIVCSHWTDFLGIARTMLSAAGLQAEALEFRDANEAAWQRGLAEASAILCDSYTASVTKMPTRPKLFVFPLLAESAKEILDGALR